MTAVIYARYSSDNQREESIEGQIRECTAYAEKNGITIVKHYIDRDAATIIMVDSNLQRENILPSKRAKAYKMKMEAIKRQGARTDLTSPKISAKFRSDDEVGQEAGVSGDTVRNYIALTQLRTDQRGCGHLGRGRGKAAGKRCRSAALHHAAVCVLAATAIPLHAISRMSIVDSIETGLKQENNIPLDKSRPARYNNTALYIAQCYYTRMVLMPAVRKVSKEQIIDAAVEVLRDDGFSAINARSVAKKLGCSTQPIYFSFKNMDELKAALTQRAIELHTQRVRDSLCAHQGNDSRYSSYGMGFVKFAAEEKQLFRWLYLEGEQPGAYQSDILTQEVIGVIVDEFGYAEDTARRFHQDMIYFTYGLAILANTDHLHLTEAELREAFRREFHALISIYGKPAKLPEFAVKAGVVL